MVAVILALLIIGVLWLALVVLAVAFFAVATRPTPAPEREVVYARPVTAVRATEAYKAAAKVAEREAVNG